MKKVKQSEEVDWKENVIGLVSVAVLMASAQCVLQLAVIVVQTIVMLPSYAP